MKAIRSYSNNFGAPNVDFFFHSDERMTVLTGRIPVDTSHADYAAADVLQIKFLVSEFPFERSEVAFAYLCAFNEGERIYAAPVRARIVSSKCIEVEKIDAYDTNSHDVELYFNTAFIVQGDPVLLQPTASQKLIFKKDGLNSKLALKHCFNRIEEDWGFLSVVFDYLSEEPNSDTVVNVEGLPTDAECDVLVFLAGHSNYTGPGCRVSKGRIVNGQLIVHNESEYSVIGSGSYIHIFFTRVKQRYTVTFKRDGVVIGTEQYVEGQFINYPERPEQYTCNPYYFHMPARDVTVNSYWVDGDPDL